MNNKKIRFLTITAILGALATVFQMFEIPVPVLVPGFIKLDFSDLPAILATFLVSPLSGVIVCLIKNIIHIATSSSVGIGELANFLTSAACVLPAGIIYKRNKTRKGALIAMLTGTLCFSLMGIMSNYFIMFPFYTTLMNIPMEAIIGMCQKILPFIDSQFEVILLSVTPANLIKGIAVSIVTFLLYKRLSPILKKFS